VLAAAAYQGEYAGHSYPSNKRWDMNARIMLSEGFMRSAAAAARRVHKAAAARVGGGAFHSSRPHFIGMS
jgi:hypothetical protein